LINGEFYEILPITWLWFTLLTVMGGGSFFKVGGAQVQAKKCIKILWLELTTVASQALEYDAIKFFFSMFKQFYAMFHRPWTPCIYNSTPYLLTLHWLRTYMQQFLILSKINSQVSTNTRSTKPWERPHITPSDRGERGRGFVARFTFSSTIWKSKLHYFRQNYTTMETYLWTTWNSNRLVLGWLQVNSFTRAHHAIYPDWLQPFELCVTEISIYIHSGWHDRCSVTLVT